MKLHNECNTFLFSFVVQNLKRFFSTNRDMQLPSRAAMVFEMSKRAGHGGTIRQSGGKIGERGATFEDSYFRKKVN